MPVVINLRRARKVKLRENVAKVAEANRAAHGRTKTEKQLAQTAAERLAKTLDGARRE